MRAVDVVVLHRLRHVLVHLALLGIDDAVARRKYIAAETQERQTIALLLLLSGCLGAVAVGEDELLGICQGDLFHLLLALEQDKLVRRHNRLFEYLHHLNDLGVVFQLSVKMRTVLVEYFHEFRFDSEILDQLLERPDLQLMTVEVRWLANVVSRVELFVNLLYLLFDFLGRAVDLHLLQDLVDLVYVEHLSSVAIGLQEQHHSLSSERICFADSVKEHDALDDEVLQPLPNEHLLVEGVHGHHVTVQRHRLQNQKVFCLTRQVLMLNFASRVVSAMSVSAML